VKRSDRLDLMIEGPRVQLPVECVDRNRQRTPPPPPPATARPAGPPAPPWVEEAVQWVGPPQWLTPPMRAEGPIVWVDPEPLRLAGPVTIWLSARFENGGSPIR
jgi:hypothetical protein